MKLAIGIGVVLALGIGACTAGAANAQPGRGAESPTYEGFWFCTDCKGEKMGFLIRRVNPQQYSIAICWKDSGDCQENALRPTSIAGDPIYPTHTATEIVRSNHGYTNHFAKYSNSPVATWVRDPSVDQAQATGTQNQGTTARKAGPAAQATSDKTTSATGSCPVEATIVGDYKKVQTLKFAALREKTLTKQELEEYFQDLSQLAQEAKSNVQSNGRRMLISYGITDTPRQRALLGCVENQSNNCADYYFSREPDDTRDTITPRLQVYQCHHDAGWPSAVDSTGGKKTTLAQRNDKNATDAAKRSTDKQDSDRAPYIAFKCVRIVQGGRGVADAYKRIHNDCASPVTVAFCLEAPGAINECLNPTRYGLSDVIPPRKYQITADAIQGPWTAWYFVCDMSNPKKQTCLPPKEIAGAAPFRN